MLICLGPFIKEWFPPLFSICKPFVVLTEVTRVGASPMRSNKSDVGKEVLPAERCEPVVQLRFELCMSWQSIVNDVPHAHKNGIFTYDINAVHDFEKHVPRAIVIVESWGVDEEVLSRTDRCLRYFTC